MDVGDKIEMERSDWNFGGSVPNSFVEHIRKSVPFYDESHDLICYLSDFFCSSNSICYELGSSTGQLIKKLATYNNHKPKIRWVGIDIEEKMVSRAKENCNNIKSIELLCDNILLFDYEKTDMTIASQELACVAGGCEI